MEHLVKDILTLSKSGIAAILNEQDRKVLLFQSSSIPEALIRQLKLMEISGELPEDRNILTFKVCEEITDPLAFGVRLRYWADHYVSNGYSLYKPVKGTRYRIRYEFDLEANVVAVKAINSRNRGIVIGAFSNLEEATVWVANTFKSEDYIVPQYATNALTQQYITAISNAGE